MVFDTMTLFHVDEVGDEVALLSRIICLAMTQWYIHIIIPWAHDTMANCMIMPMFIMILPRWWWCNHTMIPSMCMIMHDDDVVLLPPALRVPPGGNQVDGLPPASHWALAGSQLLNSKPSFGPRLLKTWPFILKFKHNPRITYFKEASCSNRRFWCALDAEKTWI